MKTKKQILTEADLKTRLKATMSEKEIGNFIKQYVSAKKQSLPDMTAINELAKKKKEANALKVNFTLSVDQYDLLSEYFEKEGKLGTEIVKDVLKEFVSQIAE